MKQTKICTQCHRELPLDQFHWRNKARGTRRSECKDCHNAHMNQRNAQNRLFIHELKKQQCCAKCGETRWYLLDYHHVDPTIKENTIARLMVHSNQQAVLKEIDKCILLCSNCHREFHYFNEQQGITLEEYLNT